MHWLILNDINGKLSMLDCSSGKLYMHKNIRHVEFVYVIFEQCHIVYALIGKIVYAENDTW